MAGPTRTIDENETAYIRRDQLEQKMYNLGFLEKDIRKEMRACVDAKVSSEQFMAHVHELMQLEEVRTKIRKELFAHCLKHGLKSQF